MREIRLFGSEGGVALIPPSLPLSASRSAELPFGAFCRLRRHANLEIGAPADFGAPAWSRLKANDLNPGITIENPTNSLGRRGRRDGRCLRFRYGGRMERGEAGSKPALRNLPERRFPNRRVGGVDRTRRTGVQRSERLAGRTMRAISKRRPHGTGRSRLQAGAPKCVGAPISKSACQWSQREGAVWEFKFKSRQVC